MVRVAAATDGNRLRTRFCITVRGAVQGVGFRPFVYRLAKECGAAGWVRNGPAGVSIEVEAEKATLDRFLLRLVDEAPPLAVITGLEYSTLDPLGCKDFRIYESDAGEETVTFMPPDVAVCPACLKELFDPDDRRYLYPFITCTHCGPRFTIIEKLPYDRPNTSMKSFQLCSDCRREYEDPLDRRFHAQPIACPACGPRLELWDEAGAVLETEHAALKAVAEAILEGNIVALKGIGGFQLLADAENDEAVRRLRRRKHREEKPFALMVPDPAAAEALCRVSPPERRLLTAPEAPIVLLRRRRRAFLSPAVAPNNPQLGIMLPYSPLHHLLMRELGKPIVATSGNLSEEPIIIDEREALKRLGGIADLFLVHNRPIVRHADDSIVRVVGGREMILRRARGYAPLPIAAPGMALKKMIAVGGHLKNTAAVSLGDQVIVSQHIGDLSTAEAMRAFEGVIEDFHRLYELDGAPAVCDLHPDYLSARFAADRFRRTIAVQHHEAHVAACMADNRLEGLLLGVAWDGVGYGRDGTLWGGEFFLVNGTIRRAAHFRSFPLPGGESAIREPRRAALGLLFEMEGERAFERPLRLWKAFSGRELDLLRQMLVKGVNSPRTCSVGRLFDAVAALLGVRMISSYEGQAAMMLEWSARKRETAVYPFALRAQGSLLVVDWQEMIEELLREGDCRAAAKFHNTLAEIICTVAERFSMEKVVLSGGCFQNVRLLETTLARLKERGFRPYWHQRIPPNDGGISVGQLLLAQKFNL